MRVQKYLKVASSLVIATIIIVSLLAVNSLNTKSDKTGGVAVQPKADAATAAPKTAAPNIATVIPTSPIVIQGTASVSVGASQIISLPFFSLLNLSAIQPVSPPLHSADIVLQTLREHLNGVDIWNLTNSTVSGKPVTVTTTYALVTEGHPGPVGGSGWAGAVNIPLRNCTVKAICTDTGKVLDHIENHPIWLIDVEGISQPAGGANARPTNHIVYGIDDLNLDYFNFGGY